MSWAAKRQVSRSEDMAYSLLGIFDVNIPLLYGEGQKKAFQRLQREIIQQSSDESIFAWNSIDRNHPNSNKGLLARSPEDFANSGCFEGPGIVSEFLSFIQVNSSVSGPRNVRLQAGPLGYLLDTILIDRNSEVDLPFDLQNLATWTTDFALPLACFVRPMVADNSGAQLRTVLIQLNQTKEREYFRAGPLIFQNLDWCELRKFVPVQRIFIQSGWVSGFTDWEDYRPPLGAGPSHAWISQAHKR